MEQIATACYVIDSEYTIVRINDAAKDIYPQIETGVKCYACLMGLNAPCATCPVLNGVKGPRTYADRERHVIENVDAVEIIDGTYGRCHAMIVSSVGEDVIASALPNTMAGLKNLALLRALTVDYYDVFSVELNTGRLSMFRLNMEPVTEERAGLYTDYEAGTETYISTYVLEEDRAMMRVRCSVPYMRERLRESESIMVHYRVELHGEIRYFYRKIVRVGEPDAFDTVVIGIGCEDSEVLSRRRELALVKSLSELEIDSLTGLYTREAFFLHGGELLEDRPDIAYDFSILKVENLGLIQRQYGGAAADKLIALIGRRLREFDLPETACMSYSGDGIFASLTANTDSGVRRANIEKLRAQIFAGSEIKDISLKWSIYTEMRRDLPLEETYARTDYALSTIRASVRRDYVEFDQSVLDRMEWEETVARGFEDALANGEFVAWFQPKYSVRTRQIIGAEALARWETPDGRRISPGEFIPILEKRGLIPRLDEAIFRMACEMQGRLRAAGLPPIPISVNLSRTSMFSGEIGALYAGIAGQYDVIPAMLPIEITESAAVRALTVQSFADDLIRRGFVLHMDDFGSGYSSLASLQVIPFESIKFDKSLIDFIGRESGESLLRHTISFARESGKSVVAEGVETYEQYLFLKAVGCDTAQGYYFSKPVDADAFLSLLKAEQEAGTE